MAKKCRLGRGLLGVFTLHRKGIQNFTTDLCSLLPPRPASTSQQEPSSGFLGVPRRSLSPSALPRLCGSLLLIITVLRVKRNENLSAFSFFFLMEQMLSTHRLRIGDEDEECNMLPPRESSATSIICSRRIYNSISDGPSTSYKQQSTTDGASLDIHQKFPWIFSAQQRFSETGSLDFATGAIVLNVYGRHGKMTGKIQFQTRRESVNLIFLDVKLWVKGNDLPLSSCSVPRSLLSSIARLPRSPSLLCHFEGEKLLLKHVPLQCYNNHSRRTGVHFKEESHACECNMLGQHTHSEVKKARVGNVELQQERHTQIASLEAEIGNLKDKLFQQTCELKACHDQVLELKGNIRVYCRCRPLTSEEGKAGNSSVIEFSPLHNHELYVHTHDGVKKAFKFDHVFTPSHSQEEVFLETEPLVVSVLDGFNVCIFAYGQTGTGKTFTMEGTEDNRGVNYRTLERLFQLASQRKGQCRYEISVSVLEVYNEEIRDLLTSTSSGHNSKKLEIKQLAEGMNHLPGAVETPVHSIEGVWNVLQTGRRARVVGSTSANKHSSRSHCLLRVMVKGENLLTKDCTKSKLWLIDLAGSERIGKTDACGERLKEAQNINKSLSALGDVIHALTSKSSHIPYRNSKITHLLQDSLGGQSKTLMFVQISPSEQDIGETLCSLNFAGRVRSVELGAARKQLHPAELLKYKKMVEKTRDDGFKKDAIIVELQAAAKVKEQTCKTLSAKVKDNEGLLALERKARVTAKEKLREQHIIIEEQRLMIQKLSAELRTKQSTLLPEPVEHKIASALTPRRPPLQERPADNGEQTATQQTRRQAPEGFVQKENVCNEVNVGTLPVKNHKRRASLNIMQHQGASTPSAIPGPNRRVVLREEPTEEVINARCRGRASLCVLPQRQSSLWLPPVASASIGKFGEPQRMRTSMACTVDPASLESGSSTHTTTPMSCRPSMAEPKRMHLTSPHFPLPGRSIDQSTAYSEGKFKARRVSNIHSNANPTRGKPPKHPHHNGQAHRELQYQRKRLIEQNGELQYQPKRLIEYEQNGDEVGHPVNKMRRLSATTPRGNPNPCNWAMPVVAPSTPGRTSLLPCTPAPLASNLLGGGHHRRASSGRLSMTPLAPWGAALPSPAAAHQPIMLGGMLGGPQRVPLSARKAGVARNLRGNY